MQRVEGRPEAPAEVSVGPSHTGPAASSSFPLVRLAASASDRDLDPVARRTSAFLQLLPASLALLSGGAAAIHFAVAGEHFAEHWASGVFLTLAAIFQGTWALLVATQRSTRVLLAGALVNGGIVAVWAVSRTTGLPVGPHAGTPESAAFADVLATVYEVSIVAGALALARFGHPSQVLGKRVAAGASAGLAAVLTVVTAAFSRLTGSPDAGHAHEAAGVLGEAAHHSFHVMFVVGAAAIFSVYLTLYFRANGGPRFSWSLRPDDQGSAHSRHPASSPTPPRRGLQPT